MKKDEKSTGDWIGAPRMERIMTAQQQLEEKIPLPSKERKSWKGKSLYNATFLPSIHAYLAYK